MECPACHSSFRVPGAFRTENKNAARKPALIIWGIIGLLVLTTAALAIFFWKHDAQKPLQTSPRSLARKTVAQSLPGDDPSVMAARTDDLQKLKQLLDEHPERLNQHYGNSGTTLLISAAFAGSANTLEELLKRNAAVNARKPKSGRTALYECVNGQGTKAMVEMLLDHKADFTIPDKSGKTPLKLAVEKTRQDIVDLLQQRGAKE